MEIRDFAPQGLVLLSPRRFEDERGWFSETFNARVFEEAGIDAAFVQDNHSLTRATGTLRGLHFQAPPFAQAKLVRCSVGAVWDVAVDVREGSPTYLQHVGVRLDAASGAQLFVPRGFLHGFLTLTPNAEVQYKVDARYSREHDGAVAWNDPDIGIAWPLDEAGVSAPSLSARDAAAPRLGDIDLPFAY